MNLFSSCILYQLYFDIMKGTVYSFRSNSSIKSYINVYDENMKKVYKLKDKDFFMFVKNIYYNVIDNIPVSSLDDLAEILYVNNGGILSEGYLRYRDLATSSRCIIFSKLLKSNTKNYYFKKMTSQPDAFLESDIKFSKQDIAVLLSNLGEENYNKCFNVIVNRLMNSMNKKKEDYKKLYKYWKNNCYSNVDFYKLEQGDNFINISIDYDSIKKSKEKLNKELLQMFSLFSRK